MNDTQMSMKSEILDLIKKYCDTYHNKEKPFKEGERIPYASRVYDHEEMVNLVDSALEFWLTSGRYTDEFEKKTCRISASKILLTGQFGIISEFECFYGVNVPVTWR